MTTKRIANLKELEIKFDGIIKDLKTATKEIKEELGESVAFKLRDYIRSGKINYGLSPYTLTKREIGKLPGSSLAVRPVTGGGALSSSGTLWRSIDYAVNKQGVSITVENSREPFWGAPLTKKGGSGKATLTAVDIYKMFENPQSREVKYTRRSQAYFAALRFGFHISQGKYHITDEENYEISRRTISRPRISLHDILLNEIITDDLLAKVRSKVE